MSLTVNGPEGTNNLARFNYITATNRPIPTVTLQAIDAIATEPGANTGKFRVTRSGISNANLKVFYTLSGIASNGLDFASLSGSTTIRAGKVSKTITIKPLDDSRVEPAETVTLTLVPNASYSVGTPSSGTITIGDND